MGFQSVLWRALLCSPGLLECPAHRRDLRHPHRPYTAPCRGPIQHPVLGGHLPEVSSRGDKVSLKLRTNSLPATPHSPYLYSTSPMHATLTTGLPYYGILRISTWSFFDFCTHIIYLTSTFNRACRHVTRPITALTLPHVYTTTAQFYCGVSI